MKKASIIFLTLAISFLYGHAQNTDYKVVFDITSSDPASQKQVVREVSLIKEGNPDAQVEVVLYGQSLALVSKDKSPYAEDIQKLVNQKGVSFNVCQIAMEHHHIDPSQLIAGVGIVPDGIYEIVKKQREGWGYIKVSP
ncbi:MAG: DsrE family protein [Ginsengibacter sp.]